MLSWRVVASCGRRWLFQQTRFVGGTTNPTLLSRGHFHGFVGPGAFSGGSDGANAEGVGGAGDEAGEGGVGTGDVWVMNAKELPKNLTGTPVLDEKTVDQVRRQLDQMCRTVMFEG